MFADINTTLQNYFSVFISFPFVVLVLGGYFLLYFREEIKTFLKNVKHFKAGKLEMSSDSQIQADTTAKRVVKKKRPTAKERKLAEELETLNNKLGEVNKTVEDKEGFIDFLIQRVTEFENGYLNLLLVPKTKATLKLLADGTAKDTIVQALRDSKNSEEEIQAVFQVLAANGLIQEQVGQVLVTDKGKRFIKSMN